MIELCARIERMQAGPGRQETQERPKHRISRINRNCHNTTSRPQRLKDRLQDTRTLVRTEQVKQVTHKDDVKTGISERQLSRVAYHNLPDARD